MILRQIQVNKMMNEMLKEKLQGGKFPAPSSIYGEIERKIRRGDIGKPFFEPEKQVPKSKFNVDKHNKNTELVEKDLLILYEALERDFFNLINRFIHLDNKTYKAERLLTKEKDELEDNKKVLDNSNDIRHIHSEMLVDLENIDLDTTNCEIKNERAFLKSNTMENKKILIPNESIAITKSEDIELQETNIEEIGSKEDILDDRENTYYTLRAISNTDLSPYIELNLDLNEPKKMNKIELLMGSPKESYIEIDYSHNYGDTWFNLNKTESNNVSISFESRYLTNIKIKIKKDEPDIKEKEQERVYNSYVFMINNLSFYNMEHYKKSILETEDIQIPLNKDLRKIEIESFEEINPSTNIDYYIYTDDQWRNIVPINRSSGVRGTVNITKPEQIVNKEIGIPIYDNESDYELPKFHTSLNNIYSITNIEENILEESLSAKKARNMWERKVYKEDIIDKIGERLETIRIDKLESKDYIEMRRGDSGVIMSSFSDFKEDEEHTYLYSCLFESKEDYKQTVEVSSNKKIAIYLNERLVYKGNPIPQEEVSYNISRGKNKLDIFIYIDDTKEEASCEIGLNIRNNFENIYGSQREMDIVNLFDLRYNTMPYDDNKLAIYKDNSNTIHLLSNYVPKGIPIDLNFVDKDEKTDSIKIRAELKRNPDVTKASPVLDGFKARFK